MWACSTWEGLVSWGFLAAQEFLQQHGESGSVMVINCIVCRKLNRDYVLQAGYRQHVDCHSDARAWGMVVASNLNAMGWSNPRVVERLNFCALKG